MVQMKILIYVKVGATSLTNQHYLVKDLVVSNVPNAPRRSTRNIFHSHLPPPPNENIKTHILHQQVKH